MAMRKTCLHILIPCLLLVLLLAATRTASAQLALSVAIDEIRNAEFPRLQAVVSVLDGYGLPLKDLTVENLSASEDERLITDLAVIPIFKHPLEIVLLIDTSGTTEYGVGVTELAKSVQAAQEFVDGLAAEDQVAVVGFASQINVVQDLTVDRTAVQIALNSLAPAGDTALNDAIIDALRLLKDRSRRPAIILLTDSFDSGISVSTFEEAIKASDEQNVAVFPIGWRSARKADLENIAELTRGLAAHTSENEPELSYYQAAFLGISEQLKAMRLQYRLEFTSSLPADGAEHNLVVKLDHLGQHVEQTRRFSTIAREVKVSLPDLTAGEEIGGKVRLAPVVEAPAELKRVEFSVDGNRLGSVNEAPFVFEWDASAYPTGMHEISVTAEDASGNRGQTSLRVAVRPAITLKIISPTDDETIGGPTKIAVNVDAVHEVAKVTFHADGGLLGEDENEPYEYLWDLNGVGAGPHTVEAVGYDVNGASNQDEVNLVVQVTDPPYWIAILAVASVAAILIPVSRRRRKKLGLASKPAVEAAPADAGAVGGHIPAAAGGQALLRELAGMNPNQVWSLVSEEVRLGRKRDENDIPLIGLKASRRHALIRYVQGQYVVYSLNQENPILVNDIPVTHQHVLQPGDILRAGDSVLRYEIQ